MDNTKPVLDPEYIYINAFKVNKNIISYNLNFSYRQYKYNEININNAKCKLFGCPNPKEYLTSKFPFLHIVIELLAIMLKKDNETIKKNVINLKFNIL